MRIVALMTVRNEALYLRRCLEHLIGQGVEVCIIDNESVDATGEIARDFLGRGVLRVETFPFPGYFDLVGILKNETALASEIQTDWFMHCDADEIREAPAPFANLREGVEAAEHSGYNAINFDEFVFLPTNMQDTFEGTDYVSLMNYYYFFAPRPLHRVNLWKKTAQPVDIVSSGGHSAKFAGRKVLPQHFILRHYVALSHAHAVDKYIRQRVYSEFEVKTLGWHRARAAVQVENICFPNAEALIELKDGNFERSQPWTKHTFLG